VKNYLGIGRPWLASFCAFAMALFFLLPGQALAQEEWAFVGFTVEPHYESWSVWSDDLTTLRGQGDDWDVAPWGPATLFRLSYSNAAFKTMLEYETAEMEFPAMGLSTRHRYALNFETRSPGEVSNGIYVGLRYYDFKFASQTDLLRDHEYFEMTMGYTVAFNPVAPGPYMNIKLMSPTLFWLFLLSTTTSDNNQVVLNDVSLPLGAEWELDVGYRMGAAPVDFALGYRGFYYNTYYDNSTAVSPNYGQSVSGVVHGVFARVTVGLWIVTGSAPETGVWIR